MLKNRIIFIFTFLLLLVGVNINAIAGVDVDEVILNETDKEQSGDESQEHEPEETITELDFFGAFSLVNVQLQWRDLHISLNDEAANSESSVNKTELSLEEVENVSSGDQDQITPSSIINNGVVPLPVSTYRTIDGKVRFKCDQNKQNVSTIAYILNCGTYPQSC